MTRELTCLHFALISLKYLMEFEFFKIEFFNFLLFLMNFIVYCFMAIDFTTFFAIFKSYEKKAIIFYIQTLKD